MAADPHWQTASLRKFPDVLLSQSLGGNRLLEAHVEILFPAHQGLIRTPERKKGGSVVQQEGHCRELGFLLRNVKIRIPAYPAQAKTCALRSPPQQLQIIFCPYANLKIIQCKKSPCGIPQRHGLLRLSLHRPTVADIGQRRENQGIHCVERILRKCQIPPPFQIIKYVGHKPFPLVF